MVVQMNFEIISRHVRTLLPFWSSLRVAVLDVTSSATSLRSATVRVAFFRPQNVQVQRFTSLSSKLWTTHHSASCRQSFETTSTSSFYSAQQPLRLGSTYGEQADLPTTMKPSSQGQRLYFEHASKFAMSVASCSLPRMPLR